ncbi:hypothetical protein [Arthrobacter sp. MYb222]|uniref:hypothetical protein n=1 Tax=Arthrobacter sp. MYb222 TaxID=1848599 RepID=UPI000CFAA5C9|nr:hypothetical protein [Arthrobacter sp. MYb222]PQZ87853.1 hypothetical protein CQ016_07015 [Arthrobacter sp. MYb222]
MLIVIEEARFHFNVGEIFTMTDIRQMAETASGMRRLKLLEAICNADTRPGYEVDTEQFEQMHDDYVSNWRAMQEDLRWMKSLGWLAFEESAAGVQGVRTQAEARDAVQEFVGLRTDSMQRAQAARDAYLLWLYDCDSSDEVSTTYDDFRSSRHGAYLGTRFSDREIGKAAAFLKDKKYMRGTLMNAGVYTSPKITTSGIEILERYGSLKNSPPSENSSVTNINVNGSHGSNVNVGGNNVTQSTSVSLEQIEKSKEFVNSARGLAPILQLSPDEQAQLLEAIDAVEAEVTAPEPKKNILVELISKTKDLALQGAASGIVHAFQQIASTALTAIGG